MVGGAEVIPCISCTEARLLSFTRSSLVARHFLLPLINIHTIEACKKSEKKDLSREAAMCDITTGFRGSARIAVIRTSRFATSQTNGRFAFWTAAMGDSACGLMLGPIRGYVVPE